MNKKKPNYHDHHNKAPLHKSVRNYVNSYINHIFYDKEKLEDFIFPSIIQNTNTWWDCNPPKPKAFRIYDLKI